MYAGKTDERWYEVESLTAEMMQYGWIDQQSKCVVWTL